jgi:hypothetical protein
MQGVNFKNENSQLRFGGEDLKSLLHIKRHVMAIQKTCHL